MLELAEYNKIIKFKLGCKNKVYIGKFPSNDNYHIMYVNNDGEIGFTTTDDCEIII